MALQQQCQVCGRRCGLRQDGTVRLHHRCSAVCLGSGYAPQGQGVDAIDAAITRNRRAEARYSATFAACRAARRNAPLPVWFWEGWSQTARERRRLEARLRRLARVATACAEARP